MPRVLAETEVDPTTEEVEATLTAAEEAEAHRRFAPAGDAPDLSDGGVIGGVTLRPMHDGKTLQKGRPAARRGWMWNGTESLLPLAWNPDGTMHDGGRRYLLKRHCLCCHTGGFRGAQCPNCVKSNCAQCRGSTDRARVHTLANGRVIHGWIISNFYLRKEDVPFPARFYGSIPCFLAFCPRQGDKGFLTDQDMRVHARSRHRMEYQAHVETLAASRGDEMESMRKRLDDLTSSLVSRQGREEERQQDMRERMAHARARKGKAKSTTA